VKKSPEQEPVRAARERTTMISGNRMKPLQTKLKRNNPVSSQRHDMTRKSSGDLYQ
jgi:hypothetical protein